MIMRTFAAVLLLTISGCAARPFACEGQEADAGASAMVQVRKRFKDPRSVYFDLPAGRMESAAPCEWVVAGYGDAANSFGGRRRFAWQARVAYGEAGEATVSDIIVETR